MNTIGQLQDWHRWVGQWWETPSVWQAKAGFSLWHRRWHLIVGVGLIIGVVLISWQYYQKILTPDEAGRQTRSAFLRWRSMIHDLFAGGNIYVGRQEYPNPPIMAIILWPFAALPPLTGALAWLYTKIVLALIAIRWCLWLAQPPHLSPLGHLTAVSLAIPALIGDLSHNNVNIFIFFLVAGCLECCRRHCDVAAGLSLALAISCKLTPLLFVPYFLWKKAWRLLLGCGVGLGLWLLVIPAGVFGWERNSQLLTDWYRLMVERPLIKGEITSEHPNQSLVGWTYRLFTDSPSFVRYVPTVEGDMPVPAAYHNVIHLPANVVWILTKVYGVTFVLLMMLLCRTPDAERSGWRRLAEYAWIILGMLLLSERTWKHHAVTLVIPGVALAAAFANGVGTPQLRRALGGMLILALLLMVIPALCGRHTQDLALVYGSHTAAFVLLAVAIACVLRRSTIDK